jgi:hypothetical protein
MVSFCDIPLSQIGKHVKRYGSYGIGMSRQWVFRNALNPVLYFKETSLVARKFIHLYDKIVATHFEHIGKVTPPRKLETSGSDIFSEMYDMIGELACYTKP